MRHAFQAYPGDQIPVDHGYNPHAFAQRRKWEAESAGLGQADVLTGAIARAAAGAFRGVRIETQITPPLDWSPASGAATDSGIGTWFMRNVVKPKVTVLTAGGPIAVAFYGEPTTNYFPLVATAGVLLAGGAALLMLKGLTSKR